MASCSSRRNAPRRSEVSWTREENKQFELALAHYDEDTPERWQKVAQFVGSKSAEDVKRHYEKLVRDIDFINSAKKPLVNFKN